MTDNDKAPASEVSSSDRAREEFEDYMVMIHHCTEDNLSVDPENDDRYFDCNIDLVWSAWQHQQSTIDSQRLALEELKAKANTVEVDGLVVGECMVREYRGKIDGLQVALEEKDKQIASRDGLIKNLSAEIAEMVPKNEKLQAKVIEMETAINNYGRHLAYCGVHNHIVPEAKYCNCGLTDYLIARS